MSFSISEIELEVDRLYSDLKRVNWEREHCALIAPLTLEINRLKKEKNAVILAHSYQTPDIIVGVSDYAGDSLGLSQAAASTDADIIVFAGVVFMAETAKILAPDKVVLQPTRKAGCSLADAITGDDVRKMKKEYPGVPVVCYVNSTADVKAESDVCVTSANVVELISKIRSDQVIFIPDKNMGHFIAKETGKEIITWDGACIVHEEYEPNQILGLKQQYVDLVVIAHSECPAEVLDAVDMVGGTSDMERYITDHPEQKKYFLVTECGLSDRLAMKYPDREFYGTCTLCPYMKEVTLENILQCLRNPKPEQIIEVPEGIAIRAKKAIDKMMEY